MCRLYILIMMVLSLATIAQEAPLSITPIQTDRPDQTETPALVPAKMFQMENGFSYEKDGDSEAFVVPSSLIKYGVNENFELRLIVEYTIAQSGDSKISGFNPILIGFKAKLAEEKGIFPKTSFIAHMSIPKWASDSLRTAFYAPEFRFTMQHTISDKISLGYNLGAQWDGSTSEPTFIYTLTTGLGITDKFGAYIELFGFAPQENKSLHNCDGGFTYLLSDDFMIDISGGFGITENAPDYYTALGFSFRF